MNIPKIIHRIWIGDSDTTEEIERYWSDWQLLHPTWELRDWDEQAIRTLPLRNQHVYNSITVESVVPHVPMAAERAVSVQRADVACYEILYQYGGVYVDCDMEPLLPLDPLIAVLDEGAFAGYEDDEHRHVSKGIIGTVAMSPVFDHAIDLVDRRYALMRDKPMNEVTGPGLMTQLLATHPGDIHVFERSVFYPHAYNDYSKPDPVDYLGSYTIHHWSSRPELDS